nr:MAG TPA: hypothetical protein [Caudoviricetes sp.]
MAFSGKAAGDLVPWRLFCWRPFLPPNGFPPATFLSLTPYNPPFPV